MSAAEVDKKRTIAEKLGAILKEEGGHDFQIEDNTRYSHLVPHWACVRKEPEYPVKTSNGREVGTMFLQGELRHVYFDLDRRIAWPDDWMDRYPVFIDRVDVYDDHVKVMILRDLDWDFMCEAYYAATSVIGFSKCFGDLSAIILKERGDRMKAGRLIPACIKDIEIYLASLTDALQKYEIDWLELEQDFSFLQAILRFTTQGMGREEIIRNVMKRAKALTEHRKKFRLEWLSSDERKACYENTMLFENDPFRKKTQIRYLCKWPFESGNEELDRWYEEVIRDQLQAFWPIYNLDGYKLGLVDHEIYTEKYTGIRRAKGGRIVVNKRAKLKKFPPEEIEFLREDFPELFR